VKLTKKTLKQLIKEVLEESAWSGSGPLAEPIEEEFENIQEDELGLNPQALGSDWIQQMENDIRSNTDDIQNILKVMKKYGMVT
jgi:hypothetical protein